MLLIINISLLERLFVLKTISRTQRATKKQFVWISLKVLRCRDTPQVRFLHCMAIRAVGNRACALLADSRACHGAEAVHFGAFIDRVLMVMF